MIGTPGARDNRPLIQDHHGGADGAAKAVAMRAFASGQDPPPLTFPLPVFPASPQAEDVADDVVRLVIGQLRVRHVGRFGNA